MTDKYPNIKRPIETAPEDEKILLWWNNGTAVEATIQNGFWVNRQGSVVFGALFWSPMPQEPEHCCGQFHALVDIKTIVTDQGHWFLKFNAEKSAPCITFCPFCGEKLK